MDRYQIETSKGLVFGTVENKQRKEMSKGKEIIVQIKVFIPEEKHDEKRLRSLYEYCDLIVEHGWLIISLYDGNYGSPEYKLNSA